MSDPQSLPRTAAIILAAGASTRLGQPKQLATLNGETLLARAVRIAREAGCAPVIVVLGAEADRIRGACPLDDTTVLVNERWREGMAASIQLGLGAAQVDDAALTADVSSSHEKESLQHAGVLLMTCDQPAVTAAHLNALAGLGELTASEYAGRRGVPAYFPKRFFASLNQLTGDAGARELLHGARTVPLAGGELDVDTLEALAEAQARFGRSKR